MEKYVNFRLEKSNLIKVINQYNHDTRLHSPKYVDRHKSSRNKTLFISDAFKCLANKTMKPKALFEKYNEEQKRIIKEKTGRKAQASAEFFNIAIMTFSNSMIKDYKNNSSLFESCSQYFFEAISKEFGIKIILAELHLDETVPHIHLLLDNISDKGKSIRRKISPKILSEIQTRMGDAFLSMGYSRGISKDITNRKHLSVRELQNINNIYERLQEENLRLENEKTVKENLIKLLAENSPKMQYIIQWIKGEVNFSSISKEEQKHVIKFINTPIKRH